MLNDVDLIKQNMYAKLKFIAKEINDKLVVEHDDFVYLSSNTNSDLFNHLYCKQSLTPAAIKFIKSKLEEQVKLNLHPDECLLAVVLDENDILKQQLTDLGMNLLLTESGMILYKDSYKTHNRKNSEIEVFRVTSHNQLDRFASVICQYIPEDAKKIIKYFSDASPILFSNSEKIRFFYAKYKGVFVATSVIFINDESAELSDVITLPNFRNVGIASTIASAAIEDAFSLGVNKITLSSSSMAFRIYEGFGFKKLLSIPIFK